MYSICQRGHNFGLCIKKVYLVEETTIHANSLHVNMILFYFHDCPTLTVTDQH